MRRFAILLSVLTLCAGAQDLVIDNFDYASDVEAQAAWHPGSGFPQVAMSDGEPWGERVMLLPCPFTQDLDRVYWDREVSLDLSAHHAIAFDISVSAPEAIGFFTLYFHVADGWYYNSITLGEPGWNTVRVPLGNFATSSATVSLEQVDRIRLSPWKGASVDTLLAVRELRAFTPNILLTEGMYGDTVTAMLTELGLEHGTITQSSIQRGGLANARLLFVGYHAYLTDATMDVVDAWVAGGGRVIAFFTLPARIASLLGLRYIDVSGQDMRAMHFDAPDVMGLPDVVEQATWNIFRAEPDRADARVIATWEADDGTMLTDPAWMMSDTGAWMSHVLLTDGGSAKRQMLLAIIGHLVPEIWPEISSRAIAQIGEVGPHTEYTAAVASIEAEAHTTPRLAPTQAWLASAESLRQSALASHASGENHLALVDAVHARDALREAYHRSQATRWPERRLCWESQGTGPYPGNWARTAEVLADNGFNGVAPIMCTGGMAHFPSTLLPHSDAFTEWGDQLAQCISACHANGIEVHARKLTWNLLWSPQSFIDLMRTAGRTQVDVYGEDIDWLCPSDPLNRAFEIDIMTEMAASYEIDGINLDFIRYPDSTCCYCDGCRERFETQTGNTVSDWPMDCHGDGPLAEAYLDWRVEQIQSFVRELDEAIDAIDSGIEISMCAFASYPRCRDSVGQDWMAWIGEDLLDFVCPMTYTDSAYRFSTLTQSHVDLVDGRIPLIPGIGVTSSSSSLTPDQAIWQATITRQLGAQGFILFSLYPQLTGETLPAFGLGLTAPPGQGMILH